MLTVYTLTQQPLLVLHEMRLCLRGARNCLTSGRPSACPPRMLTSGTARTCRRTSG